MRARSVVTALVALTAGAAASAAVRRLVRSRRPAPVAAAAPARVDVPRASAPAADVPATAALPVEPAAGRDAVVLDFARRVTPVAASAPAAERSATPVRCGDSGGRTKAGAPCGARATSGGRCHHHPVAA